MAASDSPVLPGRHNPKVLLFMVFDKPCSWIIGFRTRRESVNPKFFLVNAENKHCLLRCPQAIALNKQTPGNKGYLSCWAGWFHDMELFELGKVISSDSVFLIVDCADETEGDAGLRDIGTKGKHKHLLRMPLAAEEKGKITAALDHRHLR